MRYLTQHFSITLSQILCCPLKSGQGIIGLGMEKIIAYLKIQNLCIWTLSGLLWLQIGCQWKSGGRSDVLVIAVENLSFEQFSCDSEESNEKEAEGFQLFCDEGVRFTHAFTTSTLSQASMASIFTGLYPLEHGVRHNGNNYLSGRIETVAEVARKNGFRTGLFSGGAPILRKSGLSQGFEVFDDNIPRPPQGFYRPAHNVIQQFVSWLERGAKRPYFSVLYFSDLQFPENATVSEFGEVRERSLESQSKEISESIEILAHYLKSKGLWHNSHVMLVGLNGGKSRSNEFGPLDLNRESTQVSLYLKPARRLRDIGPQWAIDKNVTLADLGFSLFEFVGGAKPKTSLEAWPRVSFFPLVTQPKADWSDDRPILVESAWGEWRGVSNIRYSVRRKHYFYIHDQRKKLFNTLLDRQEQSPISSLDPIWLSLEDSMLVPLKQLHVDPWRISEPKIWNRFQASKIWWANELDENPHIHPQEVNFEGAQTGDTQIKRWLAEKFIQNMDWKGLLKLGEDEKDAVYIFFAKRLLGEKLKPPVGKCTRFFELTNIQKRKQSGQTSSLGCKEELFESLLQHLTRSEEEGADRWLDIFMSNWERRWVENEIGKMNMAKNMIWDVSLELPRGVSWTDLFLNLPENKNIKQLIAERRIKSRYSK